MKRLTIGLLISDIRDEYDHLLTTGIMEEAEKQDVNLVIFSGHCLAPHYDDKEKMRIEYQHNGVFAYATKDIVDALIVIHSSICSRCSRQTIDDFLSLYKDIPTIVVSGNVDGYTCINFDNTKGLYNAISELIEKKGKKKICCVAGIMGGYDPNIRLEAYKKAMKDHGLTVEDKMVEYGDLTRYCTTQVETLLANNPDVEVIVCGNDQMAIGVYDVLKKHNIVIGQDVLVLGFDDSPSSLMLIPPLSTIKNDLVGMGRTSVTTVIDYYHNRNQKNIVFDTEPVWRGSTGDINLGNLKDIVEKEGDSIDISSKEKEMIGKFVYGIKNFESQEETNIFFHKLINHFYSLHIREERRSDETTRIISKITKSVISKGVADDACFAEILKNVKEIGYKSAYLYALEEPFLNEKPVKVTDFNNPNVYLLKSYFNNNEIVQVDIEKQRFEIKNIFDNEFFDTNKRHTYMINKIFNNKEVMGVIISEPTTVLLKHHVPLVSEISTAYKTLYLLYEHKILYSYLNETLKTAREKNAALMVLSKTDPMTGLANRRGLYDYFGLHKDNPDCKGKNAIIGMIDLNDLKLINDIHGHEEGDFAINKASSIIKNSLRSPDIVARVGGDEFVIVIADPGEVTKEKIHDRIHSNFELYNRISKKPYIVSASVGLKEFIWDDNLEIDKLLTMADEEMYKEKQIKTKQYKGHHTL